MGGEGQLNLFTCALSTSNDSGKEQREKKKTRGGKISFIYVSILFKASDNV